MGGEFIDYIITDRYVTPPNQQCHFAEEFVYIPDCYQINDRHRKAAVTTPSRKELGLPEDGFVFCCFNHTYKITAGAFATWMRLLKRVPGSVLWLLASNPTATENLRRAAVESGIAAEQLVFAPMCAQAEHLARYRAANVFLDTFPVTAHTTASDALWMGVPIVTRTGTSFVERVAGSLCHAMGLPQLVTEGWQQYEDLAYSLATNKACYAETRCTLIRNKDTSPLFDSTRVTRALEDSYRMMWNRWIAGENVD
jgi:predicted O-linked N-acetylglucosamine transferase (SPINDLY family)